MSRWNLAIVLCVVLLALLETAFNSTLLPDPALQQLLERASVADQAEDNDLSSILLKEQRRAQTGRMRSATSRDSMSQMQLYESLQDLPSERRYYSYTFRDPQQHLIALAAIGLDHRAYFANSFLLGFMPFAADYAWQPLALISMRKRYMFDHDQYGPEFIDIWQNSKQAYAFGHGDCEDHAILLADWLIELGYDARVVVGKTSSGEGHAWVLLRENGNNYVLEATSKRAPKSINDFLRAERAIDYYPEIQFNRTFLWENTGSMLTTDYDGDRWQRSAQFERRFN